MRIACHFHDDLEGSAGWAQALAAALPGADVSAWRPGDAPAAHAVVWRPSQAFCDAQPALRTLFVAGAGVDALAGLRLPPHAAVVRLEDAGMAAQMADYVTHAVLHHVDGFDVYAACQAQGRWRPQPPRDKAAFPVGVLGAGVLGTAVAVRLRSLGFAVAAWARTPRPVPTDAGATVVHSGADGLAALLAASRVVVCLLPLTPLTRGLLGRAAFDRLPRGAYLINAARGAHVVQADLLQALQDGQLAGATLDVTDPEPLPPGDPLWSHPRVRLTPHVAAATLLAPAVAQIAAKLRQVEAGGAVGGTVAAGRGY